jgi:hypothetical protein
MDTKGKTKKVLEDYALQSKMLLVNLVSYLRGGPVTPPSVNHILVDIGQKRIGKILRNPDDIKTTFLTTMESLNMHTDLYTSMFDYTMPFNIINCMADHEQKEPICSLKKHFNANIVRQVHNLEPLKPELPPIDNPEVEFIPDIIAKIKRKQLIPHIHKFATDFAKVANSISKRPDPHEEL